MLFRTGETVAYEHAPELRRACRLLAALIVILGVGWAVAGAVQANFTGVQPGLAMVLLGAGMVLLAPDDHDQPVVGARRLLGSALAVAVVGLWLINLPQLHWSALTGLAPKTATCLLFLGLSLGGKRWWPKTAAGFDLLVGFTAYGVLLDLVFGVPAANAGQRPMSWMMAVALLALSVDWLALHPRRRPTAFFLETGSAGAVLRRVLPIILLFQLVTTLATAARQSGHAIRTAVGSAVFNLGLVAFIVALLWMIARALDRMDAVRAGGDSDLRASEARYRLMFEGNPQPMWIYEAGTLRFLAVNDSACRVYGYSREEFLAMDVMGVCSAEGEPADMVTGLWNHRTKTGGELEVEVFSHRITWNGVAAEVAFIHDLTARRATEAQAHILLDSSSEGIIAADLAGRCVWGNPAAVHLLGLSSAADLLGQDAAALLRGEVDADDAASEGRNEAMGAAMRAGEPFAAIEAKVRRADGSRFPADVRSAPLRRDGRLSGAVLTFADVSERRNLQNQFHQAQKMEAVGRLAAGIAHDFNNLLTVINGYADMLMRRTSEQALEPELAAKIGNIQKAGNRAAALTQQLLAFSRQQVMEPKLLDLNAVLQEMDPLLRRVMGEDLNLVTALAPDLAAVRADPGQIGQVLMNLVVNARDAMPDGGRLTIESANVELGAHYVANHPEATAGPHVMLAITDNGAGMDAATLRQVFDPFFTTKPTGKGTGLGLSTVFGIVKQSGGSVAIYSEPGRGTSVKVYLPAMRDAADSSDRDESEASLAGADPRLRVLIVEDEVIVRELLHEVLSEAGYQVAAAANPAEAIALSERDPERIDLMVTDVIMPGMDGRKLAAQLAPARPEMAVLFISGYPQQAISHNGDLDAGLAFIQKPFTPEALLRRVRQVLSEPRATRAAY